MHYIAAHSGVKMVRRAIDLISVDGKPALNLNETDPDNELYAVV